jgi:hypothetical protein
MDIILLENTFATHCPESVTGMPEHIRGGSGKLVDLPKGQMGTSSVPDMDDRVVTIIGRSQLGAPIDALVVILVGPVRRPPASIIDGIGRGQYLDRLLATTVDGEVPYLDGMVNASAEQVLAIRVPVDGSADALVMGSDLLLGPLVVQEVPALDDAVVGTEGELDSVGGRPLDISNAAADALVAISAPTRHDVSTHVPEVPKADGGVMACREQQVALVRIESELVHLAVVLVQAGQLNAGAIEVIEDDLAIGLSCRDVGVEVAVRPLDVVDAKTLALAGRRGSGDCRVLGIVENSSTQVGVLEYLGALHAHRFEDLFACENGMGALAVDVEGRDVQARLVAGILGRASANAGAGVREVP